MDEIMWTPVHDDKMLAEHPFPKLQAFMGLVPQPLFF